MQAARGKQQSDDGFIEIVGVKVDIEEYRGLVDFAKYLYSQGTIDSDDVGTLMIFCSRVVYSDVIKAAQHFARKAVQSSRRNPMTQPVEEVMEGAILDIAQMDDQLGGNGHAVENYYEEDDGGAPAGEP